ncbi:MAG: YceH family protein [Terriglobales bacterium]
MPAQKYPACLFLHAQSRYNSVDATRATNPMELILTAHEARALGALIEKDITTPEYYPLSLNALVNACNQKSNRDPVMQLDENAVRDALSGLQEHRLAGPAGGADSRVTKYEHRSQEVFNFTRAETAVLCVLLLRGPQTPGELRGRTERMHHFETLDDVQSALQKLMQRQPPLAKVLPRQPGTKESRYAHLLSGDVHTPEPVPGAPTASSPGIQGQADAERITHLEEEVIDLKREVSDLKDQLERFRKQFE